MPWADDREFRTQQAAALRAMTDPPLVRDTPHRFTRRVFWFGQPTIDPPWPVSEHLTTAPRTPQAIAFNQTFVEMRKGFKVDGEASAARRLSSPERRTHTVHPSSGLILRLAADDFSRRGCCLSSLSSQ